VPKAGTRRRFPPAMPAAAQAGAGEGQGRQTRSGGAPDRRGPPVACSPPSRAALAVAMLFLAYMHVSRTYPENIRRPTTCDVGHAARQHGLLHGWYLSDVSFSSELPPYALWVAVRAAHRHRAPRGGDDRTRCRDLLRDVARGRVVPPRGRPRMLLTAALVFAPPQLGVGVFVLTAVTRSQ